ncbi:MAG: class I SAM-dependent methyltransferase [Candidatus Levyibacteriota bacterium]
MKKLQKYQKHNKAIYNVISENATVLDVGCWTGSLGKELIRKKHCIVDGIDVEKKALVIARKHGYREVWERDLNNRKTLAIPLKKYDYIIFADVLEHVLYPKDMLQFYARYLKKDGYIVLSLPNIGFLLYRIQHLFGKFDYEETGIMDTTHVRFYTLKTMKTLIKESGFAIQKTIRYSDVTLKFAFIRLLKELFPTLFTLQFVFLLKRRS